MTDSPLIELHAVTRRYGEGQQARRVLDGVDARVMPGEIVALLGRSGSGKSTLLNLISGIDLPDSGRVLVEGRDIASLSERERTLFRRHRIGFIYQFFNLIPTLTVAENVALPLELVGRRDGGEVARLLDRVGLAGRGDEDPDRLSGGEQQRVALARALIHAPSVILADEPTGNLDAETGAQVMDLLKGLVRGQGATLVLVTHSAEVAAVADRVWRLTDGHIRDDQDEAP
ncbi:ABC transporter ATP-binding protein [Thioalkalivibrio sulfidiphilus]|uniref:ABC transporter related protein n=1 Tax=Thioalkalivibrio sulfidiphilus (strain HL-EbGR7) TaxID=396588 RepID=B8GT61_THISH|nr:ABC transporter ATP-binding protein [Thioalkalivibrio sulfidiphilus]ACL73076.1 ABC transporter related protein [Thioalkalivibrio sulfidiphilus HL-EbGr7]